MNTTIPYRVHVILDPAFGERLFSIPQTEPVWIVGSPINMAIAAAAVRPTESHLVGITLFDACECNREEAFFDVLDSIDLHHGEHSAKLPYSTLEVLGCSSSTKIRATLAELGFSITTSFPEGFTAERLE